MRVIVWLTRVVSFVLVTLIFGSAIAFGLDVKPGIPIAIVGLLSLIPSGIIGEIGVLGVLIGTHTGSTSYTGSVESPISRLFFDADSTTALATVTAVKLTLSQATKRRTGTMIPELSFSILADIAGYIDAVYQEYTATFRIKFSLPISFGGAYDLEGGALTYTLTNCTSADTIKVYTIDDPKRELDYIEIVPIACTAGGVKSLDATYGTFLFVAPSNLTRIKIKYASGLAIEYVGDEIDELARVNNPVHKVTDAGLLTAGFTTVAGINIVDAVGVEVTLTADGMIYMVKHLTAA